MSSLLHLLLFLLFAIAYYPTTLCFICPDQLQLSYNDFILDVILFHDVDVTGLRQPFVDYFIEFLRLLNPYQVLKSEASYSSDHLANVRIGFASFRDDNNEHNNCYNKDQNLTNDIDKLYSDICKTERVRVPMSYNQTNGLSGFLDLLRDDSINWTQETQTRDGKLVVRAVALFTNKEPLLEGAFPTRPKQIMLEGSGPNISERHNEPPQKRNATNQTLNQCAIYDAPSAEFLSHILSHYRAYLIPAIYTYQYNANKWMPLQKTTDYIHVWYIGQHTKRRMIRRSQNILDNLLCAAKRRFNQTMEQK